MSRVLYKYKSLVGTDFRYFVDVILNNRLYACNWRKLNDPMEGVFYHHESQQLQADALVLKKNAIRVCSLTKDSKNRLMWAHYANGSKGVAIEVEVDDPTVSMYYCDILGLVPNNLESIDANYLLSRKLKDWKYEKEERVLVENDCEEHKYISARVSKIILGNAMPKDEQGFIGKLVKVINPHIAVELHQSI